MTLLLWLWNSTLQLQGQIPPSLPSEKTIILGKPRICRWGEDYVAHDIHSGLQPTMSQALFAADQHSSAQTKPALQMHSSCCWPNPAYPRKENMPLTAKEKLHLFSWLITRAVFAINNANPWGICRQLGASYAEQEQPVNRAMGLGDAKEGCDHHNTGTWDTENS